MKNPIQLLQLKKYPLMIILKINSIQPLKIELSSVRRFLRVLSRVGVGGDGWLRRMECGAWPHWGNIDHICSVQFTILYIRSLQIDSLLEV